MSIENRVVGGVGKPVALSLAQRAGPASPASRPERAAPSATTTHPQSSRLISLADAMAAMPPPVDAARVEALREQIAGGRYALDPGAIARAMVSHYNPADAG